MQRLSTNGEIEWRWRDSLKVAISEGGVNMEIQCLANEFSFNFKSIIITKNSWNQKTAILSKKNQH